VEAMSRADLYRGYAVDCVRLAPSAGSVTAKALLLEMAERWHRLAEHTEKASGSGRDGPLAQQSPSATANDHQKASQLLTL
jgi:hypothetical protein